jgi:hypothetical protein
MVCEGMSEKTVILSVERRPAAGRPLMAAPPGDMEQDW